MVAAFQEVQTNPSIHSAVIISGKPGCFIAGADISMLEKCQSVEEVTKISRDGMLYLFCILEQKFDFFFKCFALTS